MAGGRAVDAKNHENSQERHDRTEGWHLKGNGSQDTASPSLHKATRARDMDDYDHANLNREQTRVPLTNIYRVMKKGIPEYGKASREAKQTMQDVIQEFIGFVTGEAKGICHNDKRKVLGGDDILQALENLGMGKHSQVLKEYQKRYRQSVEEVPAESEEESEVVPVTKVNDDKVNHPIYRDMVGFENLDGLLSDSLSEIHKSLGLPPITKPIPERPHYAQQSSHHINHGQSTRAQNPHRIVTEDTPNLSTRKEGFEKEQNDFSTELANSVTRRDVTVPSWTIPPALISGIRIPAINIPELTVAVELGCNRHPDTSAETTAQVSAQLDQLITTGGEKKDGKRDTTAVPGKGPAPSTEVIDLVSPSSHVPLQLLDPVALDPLDFTTLMDGNQVGTDATRRYLGDLSSPREAAAQAAAISAQLDVLHRA